MNRFAFLGLAFVTSHALAATPDYVKSCPLLFAGQASFSDRLNHALPPQWKFKTVQTEEAKGVEEDLRLAFGSGVKPWLALSEPIGQGLKNPFSMYFDLNAASKKAGSTARVDLANLWTILARASSVSGRGSGSDALAHELDQWTRSETHAVILYDILNRRGLAEYRDVLSKLVETNVFFSDAHIARSSLVTYSFEKEGKSHDITLLYQPANETQADWFKKSDDERWDEIDGLKLRAKDFQPASKIAPTSLKPSYLSGYSVDIAYDLAKNALKSWEVTHKGFEISLHRTMSELRELTGIVHETHSIHAHTVFELPRKYPRYESFRAWTKAANDTIYLRGMEEGLHGNFLTNIMNLPEDTLYGTQYGTFKARSLEAISPYNSKFFSAGLRGRMYGAPSSPDQLKIGIETRDITRNIDQLETTLTNLTDSIVSRAWERLPENDSTPATRLYIDRLKFVQLLVKEVGLPLKVAERLVRSEPSIGVPLLYLERGPVFNYKKAAYEFATPEYSARAKAARLRFVKSLQAIDQELHGFEVKGEKVERDDIEMALRQILSEWARAARPSERFNF